MQRDDAAALIAAGNTDVQDPAQIWGSPEIQDDLKLFVNSGVDLSATSCEVYGFGNYVSKTAIGRLLLPQSQHPRRRVQRRRRRDAADRRL